MQLLHGLQFASSALQQGSRAPVIGQTIECTSLPVPWARGQVLPSCITRHNIIIRIITCTIITTQPVEGTGSSSTSPSHKASYATLPFPRRRHHLNLLGTWQTRPARCPPKIIAYFWVGAGTGGGRKARETGTIWQIGVPTAERSVF